MAYDNEPYKLEPSSTQTIFEGNQKANENFAELALPNKAALKDVQENPQDSTADALMAVGAGGLLADENSAQNDNPFGEDLNNYTVSGQWVVSGAGTTTNAPLNFVDGFGIATLLVSRRPGSDGISQLFTGVRDGGGNRLTERTFFRTEYFGVWTPWRELYNTGNILGTVSQSGGVPTGAIIERGSNSNGEYVKFADGTMIVTAYDDTRAFECTETNGALFISPPPTASEAIFTYPQPFISPPEVFFRIDRSENSTPDGTGTPFAAVFVRNGGGTVLSEEIRNLVLMGISSSTVGSIAYTAIGRWY